MSIKQIMIVLDVSDECLDDVMAKVNNFRLDLEMSGLDVSFDHTVEKVKDDDDVLTDSNQ